MDGFQVNMGIRFEVFSEFGDENVHAPAQEIIVFAPNVQKHFLPSQHPVGMQA